MTAPTPWAARPATPWREPSRAPRNGIPCPHPPQEVVADILEGDGPTAVQWCKLCGAHRLMPRNPT